ncbi:MAG: type II secretion system protein [Oscillospiraceae bacterium]
MLKRIKRLLRKRNNGGFTLVEVIIASALLGILMLGVFGFVQPVLNSVKAKEQNARAVMLCETIESYIANSTKYAYFVQTFSGVTAADVTSVGGTAAPIVGVKYSGTEFPANTDDSLGLMLNCLNTTLGTTNYEIRCIGMRWLDDTKSGEKKLMLTNEVVDQSTLALDPTKTKPVFETCFYDGLYPVLNFNNYDNQYTVLDKTTGTAKDRYAADELKIAPALEISMDIYLDPSCYSVDESIRKTAMVSFVGTTYQDFRNISSTNTVNKSGAYKVQPGIEVHSYNDAYTASSGLAYSDPKVGTCYYPDTFIYFIARKTKTGGGAGGGTPTPTP